MLSLFDHVSFDPSECLGILRLFSSSLNPIMMPFLLFAVLFSVLLFKKWSSIYTKSFDSKSPFNTCVHLKWLSCYCSPQILSKRNISSIILVEVPQEMATFEPSHTFCPPEWRPLHQLTYKMGISVIVPNKLDKNNK